MAVTKFDIYSFLETYGINDLKETALISGFTDNGDGTYTCATADTSKLLDKGGVVISSSTALDGSYEIDNVVSNTSFDIIRKWNATTNTLETIATGLTATGTGVWTNVTPTFEYDRPDRLNARMNQYQGGLQKYPAIMLFEPLARSFERETSGTYNLIINNLNIAFVVKIKDDFSRDDYQNNIFDPMQDLALNFIANLESTFDDFVNSGNTYVDTIKDFKVDDYFEMVATLGGKPAFDFYAGGVLLSIPSFKIMNAGQICYE